MPRNEAQRPPAQRVLTSPDVMYMIWAFQRGLPHDLLPFYIYKMNCTAHHYMCYEAARIDSIVTPWLQVYGLARLSLLVSSLPRLHDTLAKYAAVHGRVDMLDVLRNNHHVTVPWSHVCHSCLLVLAACYDHVSVLHSLRGMIGSLQAAAVAAITHNHPSALQYMLETSDHNKMCGWLDHHILRDVAAAGHVASFEFLVHVWFPAVNPMVIHGEGKWSDCLAGAVAHRELEMAHWVAAIVASHAIDRTLLRDADTP
ncbi:Aste57867_6500 [Aphanomyces stellatus]|uniref:Aste57867_6500 protein n=1 Tax=Aphanomyces stellatus TaxID=120398 RepID=A0A485KH93_9STRA|nr:hypothetical protein As57867_006483 [Aphanomyces stellatus]VFT83485.1 Aste57867_6500 [Aphanomyces stellatus]